MISHQIAFLFPGQGSQKIGMGLEIANTFPLANQIFMEADQLLGFQLSKLTWEGPEEDLNDTINTQPALLVHSIAVMRVFFEKFPEIQPRYVAGHSMGELSALVASKVLTFPEALKLARKRGELMKMAGERSPGGMAAVLGLDIPTVDQVCKDANKPNEIVQVANDNCPGQVVISGSNPALERAISLAQVAGARKVTRLAVSIAAHSPLMSHAQEGFNQAVASSNMAEPAIPLIGNVNAAPLRSVGEVQNDLQSQLLSRVRWTETIEFLIQQGVTHFVELGSGSVLTSLLKRINREVVGVAIGSPGDFEKFVAGEV